MRYEKSCGFIVYEEIDAKRFYLLIRSVNGDYGFPKGHMEDKETEYETAVRELKEETNLEVRLVEGFRRQIEYLLPKKTNVKKQSVYFLGKRKNDDMICQESEVLEAAFVPFEEAIRMLPFDDAKEILKDADAYLESMLQR